MLSVHEGQPTEGKVIRLSSQIRHSLQACKHASMHLSPECGLCIRAAASNRTPSLSRKEERA